MIGERIGKWIIESEIGTSAMGRTYRATDVENPSQRVALRWITHPKAMTDDFQRSFLAQIGLLRRLTHPAIVAIHAGGTFRDSVYYVMDWVEAPTYEAILRRGERPAWQEALAVAIRIAPALRHAHHRSVLHRDLKPSNLFRLDAETFRLSDFGITKFFGDTLITNSDNPLGSGAYLSPETAAGKPHTKRSDFYAFGALLYTLVTGRPPFTGQTVVELIHKHCFVLPERPIHFVRDMPEEFDRLMMRLLAKDPTQRPGSGTLLIQELEAIWSLYERRGQLAKRPTAPDEEPDPEQPPEDIQAIPARLLEPIPKLSPPWHKRPIYILPLFLACVALLVWAFLFRGPTPDELMASARPLIASEKPEDWQRAWDDYLEPLSRKYPDRYTDEVQEVRRRLNHQNEIRRVIDDGRKVRYRGEAERFYYDGLRLAQAGEFASARRIWQEVEHAFGSMEGEKYGVELARKALTLLPKPEDHPPRPSPTLNLRETLQPVIAEVRRLRNEGKTREADALVQALESLYRDDPEFNSLRTALRE